MADRFLKERNFPQKGDILILKKSKEDSGLMFGIVQECNFYYKTTSFSYILLWTSEGNIVLDNYDELRDREAKVFPQVEFWSYVVNNEQLVNEFYQKL